MAYRGPEKSKDVISIYSFSSNTTYTFPLFLTEFNDQRTANWTSQEIYGKMDPIYTYKNTVRKISIGLDVPSFDSNQAFYNRNKILELQDALYPVYSEREDELGAANLSSPPLFRVYITGLLFSETENINNGLLGWIDNFNYKPELDSGFYASSYASINTFLPKLFKISFSLNVIHEKPLGFNKNHEKRGFTKTRPIQDSNEGKKPENATKEATNTNPLG